MRRLTHVAIGLLILSGVSAPLAAQQLTDAQRSAIKNACRGDYPSVCASVTPGTKEALQCLVQHSQEVSSPCQQALAPAAANSAATPASSSAGAAPAPAAGGTSAADSAPAAAAMAPTHPLSPREEAHILRVQCGADFQKFCSNVQLGAGRGVGCLRQHASDLTPACHSALMPAAPQ